MIDSLTESRSKRFDHKISTLPRAAMMPLNKNTYYSNEGNPAVPALLTGAESRILDVGCGAGDTGALIKQIHSQIVVDGITCSGREFAVASKRLDEVFVLDVERDELPVAITQSSYDTIIFLHILEHLLDPNACVRRILKCAKPGARILVAVPNIMNWRTRWKFILGRFNYEDSGPLDRTHLHFYTTDTAARYLIDPIPELRLREKRYTGSMPLGPLRRGLLPKSLCTWLDRLALKIAPNLFAFEIIMVADVSV